MTVRAELEADLDRFLAMGAAAAVPSDLARRIVVRTAHLPQVGDVVDRHSIPSSTNPLVSVPSRRRANLDWQFGTAIAASLVLLVISGSSRDLPVSAPNSTTQPIETTSDIAAIASADTPLAIVKVGPPPAMKQVALSPSEATPARAPVAYLPAGENEPSLSPLSEGEQIAKADLVSSTPSPDASLPVGQFTLAQRATAPVEVYGPTLSPDEVVPASRLAGSASAISGLAITSAPAPAAAAAPRSSRAAGPSRP